jgi:hypothetical protein
MREHGLRIAVLAEGEGEGARAGDFVELHYRHACRWLVGRTLPPPAFSFCRATS